MVQVAVYNTLQVLIHSRPTVLKYDVYQIQTSAEIPCNIHQTQICTHMTPDSNLYTQDPKTQAELSTEHHNHNTLPISYGVYDHIASISYVR